VPSQWATRHDHIGRGQSTGRGASKSGLGYVANVDEAVIEQFWQTHPCGDMQVGGLVGSYAGDYEAFFADYDRFRYKREAHILRCLDRLDVGGKKLLEVGIGEGADAEQLIRRGARYSGLDLTMAAVVRTRTRFELRRLPFEDVRHGSVLGIPWPDESFDLVFSHGVLHHVPDIHQAQREIGRVLRPGGELIAMVYARWSLNYLVAIGVARRVAVLAAYPFRQRLRPGMLRDHVRNAEARGAANYLRMRNFVHANTDGPQNPYSKVYDVPRVLADFPDFELVESWRAFMHAPPLPVQRLPGGSMLGWHLWLRLRRRVVDA
jgi:SAM-dependent methyltransferase